MTKRRDADCPLDICSGDGWIDRTDEPDTEQDPCPCGRGLPRAEPPADLHDRIMGAIRDERPNWLEMQRLINDSYNGGAS